jgi:hypothetical protein
VQGEGAGEDVDVGTVEGQVVTGEEEVERERRSSLATPLGTLAGVATVDSREIGRGTKEFS